MLVFTSCAANYLPKARVLAHSVKKQHPDWHFRLLLADPLPQMPDSDTRAFDSILQFAGLGIPDYQAWAFQHSIVEICTAVKGHALNRFLEQEKWDKVIYLDPDILVLNSLAPLERMLDQHDILLTPHQLAPQRTNQAIKDNEICSLRHGIFNLGFAAAARRGDGPAFSRFWRDRLADWCYDDKENGLFTDQKWCDLAPAYFPGLGVVRDPGCNAASWNLTDRTITKSESGEYLANGLPLRFYHFTGHDSGMGRIMSSIYGARMPAVADLWRLYDDLLAEAGQNRFKNIAWSGTAFSNGKPISSEARIFYRDNRQIRAIFPDPFLTDPDGKTGFAAWWRKYERNEKNPLYVWARKPFRLINLTRLYLARNGGIAGAPALLAKVRATWRNGGMGALLAATRKFKQNVSRNQLDLGQMLKPRSQCAQKMEAAFSGGSGVLILDHMYGGGANDYRDKRLAQFLQEGHAVLLLTWDFFGDRLDCSFRLPDGSRIDADARDLSDLLTYPNLRFGYILLNELVLWSNSGYRTDHYAAVPELLATILQLRDRDKSFLEIAINDYYAICPNYNLLEKGLEYCHVSHEPSRCRNCLEKSPFPAKKDFNISSWRKTWENALLNADEIRLFSQAAAEILKSAYEKISARIRIVPHEPLAQLERVNLPGPDRPMRIGVVGHIAWHKGSGIVRELAQMCGPEESLLVIGELDDNEGIEATGAYSREDLPQIMEREQITICLIPSIWPETWCYVAQEIMQMQLPLVVFPLGAQAERARAYAHGLVAEATNAAAALKALRELDQRRRMPGKSAG